MLDQLVPKVRDHYIEHFRAFVAHFQSKGLRGAAEVKFTLGPESPVFSRIYCTDYVENDDGEMTAHWLQPDKKLAFERFSERLGDASVDVVSLCWDDVTISFDGPAPDYAPWFDVWFDPNERDFNETSEFSGKIHSLSVGDGDCTVDFGTSPPRALFDLLELIVAAGSRRLTLSTTR